MKGLTTCGDYIEFHRGPVIIGTQPGDFWFRVWGYGLFWRDTSLHWEPLSERHAGKHGFPRTSILIRGHRFGYLKPRKP